ncbi:MAG: hypothetical protein WBO44_08945 [Saprospiraceae bacterium]
MKQSMFIALFLITMNVIHGQTVNGVPMDSIKTDYVEIGGTEKFLSTKMNVEIDFGQRQKYWSQKDTRLVDEHGKSLELNSMIDALNFMSKHGYSFVDSYIVTKDGINVYHYLLKRINQ